jgi:hypothetical protein
MHKFMLKILWSTFMFRSLWKVMPVLTLGIGAGLNADHANSQQSVKVCGLNEGECCLPTNCKNTMGGAIGFDLLYWGAENPGFTLAYQQKNSSCIASPTSNDVGSIVRIKTAWDPGFRLGAGWNTNFDRWDVFANWTWFQDHATRKLTQQYAASPLGYYPPITLENINFKNVYGSWRFLHNALDLELGRAFYITKALSLRPHWGLRGSWLHQKFKSTFSQALQDTYSEYYFHGKNTYSGIGPRVGINGDWHIDNSSWSVVGKASTSLLIGVTHTHMTNQFITPSTAFMQTERSHKDHFTQLVPNLQVFLGLYWGSCLDCDHYYLSFSAGWEANIYWNQYNLPTPVQAYVVPISGIAGHAVTMQGLTASVHFDY